MTVSDDLICCVRFFAEERFGENEANRMICDACGDVDKLFCLYRDLVNVREPMPVPEDILDAQDRMLSERISHAGITDADVLPRISLDSRISLWRGDITTLAADAIVNAANSQMLGCWIRDISASTMRSTRSRESSCAPNAAASCASRGVLSRQAWRR